MKFWLIATLAVTHRDISSIHYYDALYSNNNEQATKFEQVSGTEEVSIAIGNWPLSCLKDGEDTQKYGQDIGWDGGID